jgi:hypothetical protein
MESNSTITLVVVVVVVVLALYFSRKETFIFWRTPESPVHDNIVTLNRADFREDFNGKEEMDGTLFDVWDVTKQINYKLNKR